MIDITTGEEIAYTEFMNDRKTCIDAFPAAMRLSNYNSGTEYATPR